MKYRMNLQMFASGANVQYTGMDSSGAYDPTKAGTINVNTGSANANAVGHLTPEMKTFYEKVLIRLAGPKLVHDQFGQKKPIPKGNGRTIEFRKFATLPKALQPLKEGVTPVGNKQKVEPLTATVEQYGDFIETTDMLELTAYDDIIGENTKSLADQAGRTLDTVTREILNCGTNVYKCPKVSGSTETTPTTRADFDGTALLRVKDVFKAAAILKGANAPKIGDSYVAIIHPYVSYDLMQAAGDAWIDVSKYTDPGTIMKGEIGKLGGVRFVETTEAKIFAPAEIADGYTKLTVKTAIESSTSSVVVNEEIESASDLAIDCYIGGVANKITAITKGSKQSTLTVQTAITSLTAGAVVCGQGAAKNGLAVFSTLFLGADAYGVTEVAGGGLEHVFKGRGEVGNDNLNQRSSVGWKATKTAEILVDSYILRVESCSSFSDVAEAN